MISGVAQVIGMKPIFRSGFSGLPFSCASASSVPNGNSDDTTALAADAPTAVRNLRLSACCGNSARMTAVSSRRRSSKSCSACEWCAPHMHLKADTEPPSWIRAPAICTKRAKRFARYLPRCAPRNAPLPARPWCIGAFGAPPWHTAKLRRMPELPDVTVYIEALESRVLGHRLEHVRLLNPFILRTAVPPITSAEGKRVTEIRRIGKRIVFVLEGALYLVLHLMIAGRLRWLEPRAKPPGRITLARLFDATRATLREWTDRVRAEARGALPEKVTAFREGMAVHGRYGKPCPVCGAPVQRIVFAENETNYCARCQTGGKLLADRALSRLLKKSWPRTLEELE